MLTGFTSPTESLAVEIKQIHDQVIDIASGFSELRRLPVDLAGIAATVRHVHQIVSVEVSDCPRLFTFGKLKEKPSFFDRRRVLQDHYQLTLWCEHPGYEHPWAKATYDIREFKPWFVTVAPYARLVFKTLQLAVPVAAAIDLSTLPSATRDDAKVRLDVMQSIVGDLPTDSLQETGYEFADLGDDGRKLTQAEGQALRAVRQMIFAADPLHTFLAICAGSRHLPETCSGSAQITTSSMILASPSFLIPENPENRAKGAGTKQAATDSVKA